jgi:NADH-quinone oxidoreductase subunit G
MVELSPVDADRLGVRDGDRVELVPGLPAGDAGAANGTRVRGAARLRASVPAGSVFILEGTEDEPANLLTEPLAKLRRVGTGAELPEAAPVIVTPAGEGHGEARASAPLNIPPTSGRSA